MSLHNRRAAAGWLVILPLVILLFGCERLVGPKPDYVIQGPPIPQAPASKLPSNAPDQSFDTYQLKACALLRDGNFDALNAMIEDGHANKVRLYGGYWKTYAIFLGLERTAIGFPMSDEQWKAQVEHLNAWKQRFPDSPWPRLALAQAMTERAFDSRKKEDGDATIKLAKQELADLEKQQSATDLPQFYVVALRIGQFERAPLEQQMKTFETGVAIDPSYYHLYSVMGHYLRPDYSGHGGDVGSFIRTSGSRVPEKESRILYFEYSSSIQNAFGLAIWQLTGLEYTRARDGYSDLEKTYGADNYRKNMMMFMAVAAGDHDTAAKMMAEVGDRWDNKVWVTSDLFYAAKAAILGGFKSQPAPQAPAPPQHGSV